MVEPLKLLVVFAHPDDESLGMGTTLAKYAAEGVEIHLVCATRGERGWTGAPESNPGLGALGRIREAELDCAARCLGLRGVRFLDYIDGDVDRANPQQAIARVAAHIRHIRPQVVVTFSPDGAYGHPDHIAIAQFTAGGLVCAADAGYQDPDHQLPHTVSKFYHLVDSQRMVDAVRNKIGLITIGVDGVERSHIGWEPWAITTRIDCAAYFDAAWQAILCHQSQLSGYEPLTDLPREDLLEFWGEGTFVRIFSLVNGGRRLERDLFEGLRDGSAGA